MSISYTFVALIDQMNFFEGLANLEGYEYVGPDAFEWGSEGRWVESTKISVIISNPKEYLEPTELNNYDSEIPIKIVLKIFNKQAIITFSRFSTHISTTAHALRSIIVNIDTKYREEGVIDLNSSDYQSLGVILNAFRPIYARMIGDWSSFPLTTEEKSYNKEEFSPFWKHDFGNTRFLGKVVLGYIRNYCAFLDIFNDSLDCFMTIDGGVLVTAKKIIYEEREDISRFSTETLSNLRNCLDTFSDEDYMTTII